MNKDAVVAVAMSGGVDSSVAAALLHEQGYALIGLMLSLWSAAPQTPNRCCSPADQSLARRVAGKLGIPFYTLDARHAFRSNVVDAFIDGYAQGVTPNPCLRCNRLIRWGFLLEKARSLGATHLATGHYARIHADPSRCQLLRARDRSKDQSYVLSVLDQKALRQTLLPLGEWTKREVREKARDLALPVADKSDSQDLCFLGGLDYRTFLETRAALPHKPGPIITRSGEPLGRHGGLHRYTIGQRKGLGISAHEPLYVLEKDVQANRLIVGPRSALGRSEFDVDEINWIAGEPPDAPIDVSVQVRYRAREVNATVTPLADKGAHITLHEPLPDVTAGQAAVFYDGDVCLGGGLIRG